MRGEIFKLFAMKHELKSHVNQCLWAKKRGSKIVYVNSRFWHSIFFVIVNQIVIALIH